jgi:hypothetical protein
LDGNELLLREQVALEPSIQQEQQIHDENDMRMSDLIYFVEIVNEPAPDADDQSVMMLWVGLFWAWGTGNIKIGFEWRMLTAD